MSILLFTFSSFIRWLLSKYKIGQKSFIYFTLFLLVWKTKIWKKCIHNVNHHGTVHKLSQEFSFSNIARNSLFFIIARVIIFHKKYYIWIKSTKLFMKNKEKFIFSSPVKNFFQTKEHKIFSTNSSNSKSSNSEISNWNTVNPLISGHSKGRTPLINGQIYFSGSLRFLVKTYKRRTPSSIPYGIR